MIKFRSFASVLAAVAISASLAWHMSRAAATEHESHDTSTNKTADTGLHAFVREPADPEWLVRVGEFHGHLGPWVVLGAMIGRDALNRLNTRGYWDIEVIVWMPPEKQRQPWSCILDGLQVSTGATLGKRNIGFDFAPEHVKNGRSTVFVKRLAHANNPCAGVAYTVNERLAASLTRLDPQALESQSRALARQNVLELFEIRDLSTTELKDSPPPASRP